MFGDVARRAVQSAYCAGSTWLHAVGKSFTRRPNSTGQHQPAWRTCDRVEGRLQLFDSGDTKMWFSPGKTWSSTKLAWPLTLTSPKTIATSGNAAAVCLLLSTVVLLSKAVQLQRGAVSVWNPNCSSRSKSRCSLLGIFSCVGPWRQCLVDPLVDTK
jgi:hypothetical protein